MVGSAGLVAGFAGAYQVSQEQLEEAEQIATELDDQLNLGRTQWGRCIVAWSFVQLPAAVDAGRRAVEHLRSSGDVFTLADALAWLAFPLATVAGLAEGAVCARESIDLAMKIGHLGAEVVARRGLLLTSTLPQGDLEGLEAGVRKDLELCLSMNSPWSSQGYAWIGIALTLRGELDEALEQAEQALAIEPASAWTGIALASRLMNRSYAGDSEAVDEIVRDQLEMFRSIADPPPFGQLVLLSVAAEAAAILGRREWCAEFYPRIAAGAELITLRPFDSAVMHRVAGMVAACVEDWDRAEQHFETALSQAAAIPSAIDEPQVQHFYARMLFDRGNSDDQARARDLGTAALAGYRKLGIPLRAAMAEELLQAN